MLAFLPWLRLREPIRFERFFLLPHVVASDLPQDTASDVSVGTIGRVLSHYYDGANRPLSTVVLLQYDGKPLGADFDQYEQGEIFRFGRYLAVSGMCDRRFIGGFHNNYTATGHYQILLQGFSEPYQGGVNLTYRRKDGHANVFMGETDIRFFRPAHLVFQGEPTLNIDMLRGLQLLHTVNGDVREHIEASITQYLLANSDSPDVSREVETIATCSALERVTNASQRVDDLQAKTLACVAIVDDSPWTEALGAYLNTSAKGRPILRAWVKQLYVLRGRLAHGKPAHCAQKMWSQDEHLLAGAFIYPLVLKCQLSAMGLYRMTDEDVAHVLGLDALLGARPFFEVLEELTADMEQPDGRETRNTSYLAGGRPNLNRWQQQFETINLALVSIAIRHSVRETIDNHFSTSGQD